MAKISIVIPVYYNAPTLPALFERLDGVVKANPQHGFEFICVDDGSGDDSFLVLQQLARENKQLKLVKLVRNFGEPAASFAGMSFASGDAVAVIAADLQDPPEDVNRLIAEWEQGHKVVLAVRKEFYRLLDMEYSLIKEFRPDDGQSKLPFIFDEIYGPAVGLWQRERPGPVLKIYAVNSAGGQ